MLDFRPGKLDFPRSKNDRGYDAREKKIYIYIYVFLGTHEYSRIGGRKKKQREECPPHGGFWKEEERREEKKKKVGKKIGSGYAFGPCSV